MVDKILEVSYDYFLPYPMFGDEVLKLVDDVNIMIGTTKTEFLAAASYMTGDDIGKTKNVIAERYKDKADAYMEAVRKAYPDIERASDYLAGSQNTEYLLFLRYLACIS